MTNLLLELKKQEEKLFNCVQCGFCLPACPTYTRLGDEADSPRGRIHFMRALVEGRIAPASSTLNRHLDRCLGCRACESVCPSGVEYGRLLEGAREVTFGALEPNLLSRLLGRVMATPSLRGPVMALARGLRATGFPQVAAQRLPKEGLLGQARLGFGMIAATEAPEVLRREPALATGHGLQLFGAPERRANPGTKGGSPNGIGGGSRIGVLAGCVQEGLLGRVNRATQRVLEANGFRLVEVSGQGCCGAIHAHTGDMAGARELARANIRAFGSLELDFIAVNAAGCGATMKDYPHLLAGDSEYAERAETLALKVRDVSELLGQDGLRVGGKLPLKVTYDAPCHLLHAQRISKEPLVLMAAVPGLDLVPLKGSDECCGGAGIYGITHAELGGQITEDKVRAILSTGADVVATGNPGCMMQIGAGLRMQGAPVAVVHPLELLDESYRRGGFYA
ncbi:MAG: heterodisulfide reductase-related iron-sulfur binding cluster [Gemmatimonadota bacterium]